MTTNKHYWLLAAFILIAAIWSTNTEAQTRLYLGAATQHFGSKHYNERHKLLMLEHDGVVVGYFNNSYDEDSFLAGYKWRAQALDLPVPDLETSVIAAGTYGYRDCIKGWAQDDRRVCGMVAVQLDYTAHERFHPSVVVTPVFVGVTAAVVF